MRNKISKKKESYKSKHGFTSPFYNINFVNIHIFSDLKKKLKNKVKNLGQKSFRHAF